MTLLSSKDFLINIFVPSILGNLVEVKILTFISPEFRHCRASRLDSLRVRDEIADKKAFLRTSGALQVLDNVRLGMVTICADIWPVKC